MDSNQPMGKGSRVGLEPTQSISCKKGFTAPGLRAALPTELPRQIVCGGPSWSRTSRAMKHLIYSQVRCLLRDTGPYMLSLKKRELVKENNAYFPPFSRSRRAIAARSIRHLLAVFSQRAFESLATLTGLEPVTSGVTGRRTDQNCATEPCNDCCEQQSLSYFT